MPTRRFNAATPSRRRLRGSRLTSPRGARRLRRAIQEGRSAAVAPALIVFAALSLFVSACGHQPAGAGHGAETAALEALAIHAQRLAREDAFSGAVLVAKDGRVLFSRAYGLADRERRIPNTVQTRFRIASMTKMFTAVAILQLVEAGKVKLTAPLDTYLPDYPNREVAAKVTIGRLLTHTSGLGGINALAGGYGDINYADPRTNGLGDIPLAEIDRGDIDPFADAYAHRRELRTLADYVRRYGKRGLKFKPGSRWAYSNYGFLLLGVVIEKVTGQSYYDYVQQHIYAPAGMTRSGSLPEDQAVPGRAIGYTKRWAHAAWEPNANKFYRGTSFCCSYSTVGDLARFAHALLAYKLLSPDLTARLFSGKARMSRYAEAVNGRNVRQAYGFIDARHADGTGWVGYGGGEPSMSGELWIYPKPGYVVAVLANLDPPAADRLTHYLDPRLPTAR